MAINTLYFAEFLENGTHASFTLFLSSALLFLLRAMPILIQAPFFGATVLPAPAKFLFAGTLFLISFPKLLLTDALPFIGSGAFLPYLIKELAVGFILGFLSTIPFQIASGAGMLIDFQRGSSSLAAHDPTIRSQSSPMGLFYNQILLALFFFNRGPQHFIDFFLSSYDLLPIDQLLQHLTFDEKHSPFWEQMITLLNFFFKSLLQLAAPALLSILMTDTFLGIANRLAPQVQITFLGMPLKSLLTLGILFLSWRIISEEMIEQSLSWLFSLKQLLPTILK